MNVLPSIILSLLLGLLAFLKKALTYPALILAIIFAFIITYYGGLSAFIILVSVFIGSIITKILNKEKKSEKRKFIQIISNVGMATFSIILFKLTLNDLYLLIYAAVMAESLADTLASDIGMLSKKDPINLLTWKKGEKGLSGNISLLGIASSFVGSFVIAIIYFLGINSNIEETLIIIASGVVGSLVDSFLGATIQVKYKCPKCNKITEKKKHCNKKTKYIRGVKWIDNNMVNLLSNLFIFLFLSITFW